MVIAIGINTAECAQKKNWVAMELVHFISSPSKTDTSHSTCNTSDYGQLSCKYLHLMELGMAGTAFMS